MATVCSCCSSSEVPDPDYEKGILAGAPRIRKHEKKWSQECLGILFPEDCLCPCRLRLSDLPASHVWPFQHFFATEKAAYLMRQHIFANLYHRLSTRPFFGNIEKVPLASIHNPSDFSIRLNDTTSLCRSLFFLSLLEASRCLERPLYVQKVVVLLMPVLVSKGLSFSVSSLSRYVVLVNQAKVKRAET